MWQPVSKLEYQPLNPTGRVLVVTCPLQPPATPVHARWAARAVAVVGDSQRYLRAVVRDVLANPQIRAVVFDGPCCGRAAYHAFWTGTTDPGWRIDKEHLDLVRQFVDLYDDDCHWRTPPQPFWPVRIAYTEELETL